MAASSTGSCWKASLASSFGRRRQAFAALLIALSICSASLQGADAPISVDVERHADKTYMVDALVRRRCSRRISRGPC